MYECIKDMMMVYMTNLRLYFLVFHYLFGFYALSSPKFRSVCNVCI